MLSALSSPSTLSDRLKKWLRRWPLELAGDPSRVPPDAPGAAAGAVDVVVPIHGAAAELERCLASLARHTDMTLHRILLVVDGPQPAEVGAAIAGAVERQPGFVVRQRAVRGGFVAAVNQGMGESERDVVLLNSDTEVTAGWLEKLRRAAYSAPEIATVTPFSNSATICSLPRFLESNALPAGWSVDAMARLVEERSQAVYPKLPTGVGVCLYIKRKALEALGLFDPRRFGLGYGEESEFCMRALKAGYAHVLDDATFIFHAGHSSFGVSRRGRIARAHRRLARLHPEYLATVARFLREDPLAPLRERVTAALAPPRRPAAARSAGPERVLHVVHGWPPWNHAGTELYAAWLVRRQARHHEVTVYSRIADPARGLGDAVELLDGGARVRLAVRNFTERDPLSRNALRCLPVERDFARLLAEARPQLVHVHHLAGHDLQLPAMVRRLGVPLLYQVQDWWAPCARANLLDRGRQLCSGPAAGKCAACLPLTRRPPAALLNRLLYGYRARAAAGALRAADAWVMGSRFIHESYLHLGLLHAGDPTYVVPYGVEVAPGAPRRTPPPQRSLQLHPAAAGGGMQASLRCGVIGSILPHKGIHVAVAAFAGVDPGRARLTVWGDAAIAPDYTRELLALGASFDAAAPVRLAGRFDDSAKADLFAQLDVLIVPSLGLESFGLVAREAMHHGVPVLASRRGALVELFPPEADADADAAAGALFAPGDPRELRGWIDRLVAEPRLLAGWIAALPAVKSADRHAEEIEEVYRRVLAARQTDHKAGQGTGQGQGAGRNDGRRGGA